MRQSTRNQATTTAGKPLHHSLTPRLHVTPVSQVTIQLSTDNHPSAFKRVRDTLLKWIERKAHGHLSSDAWDGKSFIHSELGSQPVEAIALEISKTQFWVARSSDADKRIPQRIWTTEIAIGHKPKSDIVLLSMHLHRIDSKIDPRGDRSIPRCISDVVQRYPSYLDGRPLSITPWQLTTKSDIDDFLELLSSKHRRHDIIVFSYADNEAEIYQNHLMATNVAKRLVGAAHVATITSDGSQYITRKIGAEFSVFNSGIRTYRPRFDLEQDETFRHPFATKYAIYDFNHLRPMAFPDKLVRDVLRRSVYEKNDSHVLPRFSVFRKIQADQESINDKNILQQLQKSYELARAITSEQNIRGDLQKRLKNLDHRNTLLEQQRAVQTKEIERLRKQMEDSDRERSELEELLKYAELERDQATDSAHLHQSRIFELKHRIGILEKSRSITTSDIIPDRLNGFSEWCKAHLSGHIRVLNRAIREVQKSKFNDPKLIYNALILLRDKYVPMKRDKDNSTVGQRRQHLDDACNNLKVEISKTFRSHLVGDFKHKYSINYGGRVRWLDRHLKHGVRRDPQSLLRIYFFWDEESSEVIVGWLPSHLPNRSS